MLGVSDLERFWKSEHSIYLPDNNSKQMSISLSIDIRPITAMFKNRNLLLNFGKTCKQTSYSVHLRDLQLQNVTHR